METDKKRKLTAHRLRAMPLALLLLILVFSGCQQPQAPKETSRIGYLKAAEDHFFYFNEVLWITLEDEGEIERLGLEPDADMPGGFYLYDESVEWEVLDPGDSVSYTVLDPYPESKVVTRPLFRNMLDEREEMLVRIKYADGNTSEIIEQYLP